MHRKPEVLEAEAQVEECLYCPARITSKELAQLHFVKSGTLQNACSTRQRVDADLENSALMRIARLKNKEQPSKRSKKNGDRSAVAMLKITRQLGCVFQAMEPPRSSSILRKSSNILKPIRCVRFTKAVIFISVTSMLQNLRIGLRKRQSGKSDVPAKQRGGWPKISKNEEKR